MTKDRFRNGRDYFPVPYRNFKDTGIEFQDETAYISDKYRVIRESTKVIDGLTSGRFSPESSLRTYMNKITVKDPEWKELYDLVNDPFLYVQNGRGSYR